MTRTDTSSRDKFKTAIRERALVKAKDGSRITKTGPDGNSIEHEWIFDFRAVMLEPQWLNAYAEIFWERYASLLPFQVGGLETAGIPLVSAIVMKGVERGTPVNGFFIRKSRKREGLMKAIEGTLTKEPVILVDDLLNSGETFNRQIGILEDAGARVSDVFAILAFRAPEAYGFAQEKKIRLSWLYTLEDFEIPMLASGADTSREAYRVAWKFSAGHPSFEHVVPKSAPALGADLLYTGSDDGTFYAIEQKTGEVAWTFATGKHPYGKGVFSSPALYKNIVYFGAYDGNVYALDAKTGAMRWKYDEADWVGSSPAIAPDLGLLFIGLEFGLFRKRGGIVALDLQTGEKKWVDRTQEFTHGSPLYIREEKMVIVGSNDGVVYAYDARTGARRWNFRSHGEVKASLAYDPIRRYVLFGSFDGRLYALSARDGAMAFSFPTSAALYSTPLVVENTAYIASLDKYLYAIDLETGKERFAFQTGGRVFASPTIAEGSIWLGSNDGRLCEIDPSTGKLRSSFQATERIVNAIAYNEKTKCFFVPTVANELYCLERANVSSGS